jgi:hypothetical protein
VEIVKSNLIMKGIRSILKLGKICALQLLAKVKHLEPCRIILKEFMRAN